MQETNPIADRKPVPLPPPGFEDLLNGSSTLDGTLPENINEESYKVYYDRALDRCGNCGRTFLPERLQVHVRSCNKAHGKPVPIPESPGMIKSAMISGEKRALRLSKGE
jgi:hypothetical protein